MTRRPLFVARLVGTQAEMGAQHGALAAEDARRLFGFYRTMPERMLAGGGGAIDKLAVRGIATAWQARLARERPPEYAARTAAFVEAAGAGLPARERRTARLTIATMDTMQNCVSLAARMKLGPFGSKAARRAAAAAVPACTSVIAWGRATQDGELLFARNFDFPGVGVWDTAPAFVTCVPDVGQRYAFFTTRGGDVPVVSVVNEAGLAIAPHTRWHRDVTWGGAMIVDVVHEIARKAESLDDAIRIARERPASSSWGIAIGSARERGGIVLELAGPHVEVVRPRPGADYLACTNRYRNDAIARGEVSASRAWPHHSNHREQRMRALVEQRGPVTPRDLASFLGDREFAGRRRHLGSILTQPTNVHAVVFAPSKRMAWAGVDRAPCTEGTWAEVAWDWQGPAGGWELGAHAGSGFALRELPDFAGAHDAATAHVREAVRVFEHAHDIPATRAALELAIAAEPDDPSLRLGAAWLALEDRAPDRAIAHVQAGLAVETEPFRRGQLLACGARAARTGDPGLAERWLDELARLDCDGADELRAHARRRAPIRTNLVMTDAY